MGGLFITGTDTGVGKTYVTRLLLQELAQLGLRAAGYKPVAAGAELVDGAWRNEDGLLLLEAGAPGLSYEDVNPVCLPLPASPHLAASDAGTSISLTYLIEQGLKLTENHDIVLAEGAGGWRVPLSDKDDIADLAHGLAWPVIVVVGLRLGCINHARLTLDAVAADGLNVAGWIANHMMQNEEASAAMIEAIDARVDAPLLAEVGSAAAQLEWTSLGAEWLKVFCK